MKLHAVELFLRVLHSCIWTMCRMSSIGKAFWKFGDIVGMTHPGNCSFRKIMKKNTIRIINSVCFSVFSAVSRFDLSAKQMGHQLISITNSKNRNSHFKNSRITFWGFLQIHTIWTTRKNNSSWVHFFDFFEICFIGMNFTVYSQITYTARNQLIVLAAKI